MPALRVGHRPLGVEKQAQLRLVGLRPVGMGRERRRRDASADKENEAKRYCSHRIRPEFKRDARRHRPIGRPDAYPTHGGIGSICSWRNAHAPQGFLDGQLLIAMPSMADKRFARSVVYICAHSGDGAMGIVINKLASEVSFP